MPRPLVVIYQDKRGEWRWRLVAANGNIQADSGEGYTRKLSCRRAVRSVIRAFRGQLRWIERNEARKTRGLHL
jgi:uncharacterized protein